MMALGAQPHYRAVATGPVGPVSTGPLSGALSHVFLVNQRLVNGCENESQGIAPEPSRHAPSSKGRCVPQTNVSEVENHAVLCVESVVEPFSTCTVHGQRSRGNPFTLRVRIHDTRTLAIDHV